MTIIYFTIGITAFTMVMILLAYIGWACTIDKLKRPIFWKTNDFVGDVVGDIILGGITVIIIAIASVFIWALSMILFDLGQYIAWEIFKNK